MMNTPTNLTPLPPEEGMPHLDADLRSLAAGLDALGASDCAALDAGFEDRLMQATLVSLHGVEPVAAAAAELGAMDRAAAPSDLEQGVFAESVPALREGAAVPMLRHVGEPERTPRRHVRAAARPWWANQYVRLAAAVVLVAGVGIIVRTAITPTKPDTETLLADRVSGEMDLLFAAIEGKPATSDTPDAATPGDPDDLTKWLMEGAAS